jgi:NodT family efflux transporter outer membrane factor (OMF) lipoprotein
MRVFRRWRAAGHKWPRSLPRSLQIGCTCARFRAAQLYARRPLAMLTATVVGACAVGPDFAPPPAPDVTGYTPASTPARTVGVDIASGERQRFQIGRDIPGDWWRLFGSPSVTALIERALANNQTLEAAQAAVRVAQANMAAGRGALFPIIDANVTAVRQKPPLAGPAVPNENGNLVLTESPTFNLFTGQVLVSYAPDVFGGIRRNIESLQAQTDNQRFQLEATYLSLTSNVALAAVQQAALLAQLKATQEELDAVQTEIKRVEKNHNQYGCSAQELPYCAETSGYRTVREQIALTLPSLRRQIAQQRHLISALIGDPPNHTQLEVSLPTVIIKLDEQKKCTTSSLNAFGQSLHLPRDLPLSVPSQLVRQRPDLRAAEENLHAASAQIGVAIANRLPNLTLTAGIGSNAPAIEQLFSPGTSVWALSGGVLQPIFHGGILFQREVAARAAFEQALSQYRNAVVISFQNVADTLTALENDADALKKAVANACTAKQFVDAASAAEKTNDSGAAYVTAMQAYLQARLNLIQAQANRFADTVALFQALGGGWWHNGHVAPPKEYRLFSPFE